MKDWQDLTHVPPDERHAAIVNFSNALAEERARGVRLPAILAVMSRCDLEDLVMDLVEAVKAKAAEDKR